MFTIIKETSKQFTEFKSEQNCLRFDRLYIKNQDLNSLKHSKL